ncbi:hypothetical protein E2C01_032791 [Portunus trituberculatus]|uniref:Uncharacterized protein n=1 Tax=Portunus trituberculatus TaxID=210409 RepID=A0A5B7EW61_PORTR|nr:hypothetical protein [Portunus trituberculatus]
MVNSSLICRSTDNSRSGFDTGLRSRAATAVTYPKRSTDSRFTPETRHTTYESQADFGYYGYVHTGRDARRDSLCGGRWLI